MRADRQAISLVEVITIVAIICILSGLLLVSPHGHHPPRRQVEITVELHQIGAAIDDFRNAYGIYPPNLLANAVDLGGDDRGVSLRTDMLSAFKTAFPRHQETEALILALAGAIDESRTVMALTDGMTSSEAVFFWLGGFSEDPQYPISGADGPSFSDAEGNGDGILDARDEDLQSRDLHYEFDLTRLGPRTDSGLFDDKHPGAAIGRYVEYDDPRDGTRRRINFWRYYPRGSTVAIEYFDVSRYTPAEYYPAIHSASMGNVGPLTQLSSEASPQPHAREDLVFVEQGKFQLLHAGFDDVWGDWSAIRAGTVVAPTGPFLGDLADTLANFMPGTLEDKQE